MTARTRIGLILLAIVVLTPVVGLALLAATFDPNRYKPQIVDAVKRATGRDLALNGPLSLKPSLWPTLEARDVALANIEGGSRPQMMTLGRLEAQVPLLPLLRRRLEIDRLVLLRPDILLETNAQGQPNWRFGPTVPSQPLPQPAPPNASKAGPLEITVKDVRIEDGTLTYRADTSSKVLGVNRLEAKAAASDSPVHLAVQASYNAAPFALEGDIGPLSRLSEPDSPAPWPVRLAFASNGAQLAVAGALTHPLQGRGYSLKLDGHIANLATLQAFYPLAPLPPVQDLAVAAQLADSGGAIPDISALTLHAGASDLSSVVPGLLLTRLDIAAARMDQPVQASAEGTFAGAPLAAEARFGAPTSLISGAGNGGAFPVDVSAHAAGASVAVKGGLADPVHLSGADLAVTATVPDLPALSPLARRPLPPLANIAFEGKIGDRDGGLLHGAMLHDGKLTLPQGDLSGNIGIGFAGRPSMQAVLTSNRIDLDGLSAALTTTRPPAVSPVQAPVAPPVVPPGQPASQASPAPAASPASPAPPAPPSGRVIPDEPLRFDRLNFADADVRIQVGALTSGGIVYRDVAGRLALSNGRLALDPFAAQLPGGRMEMKLTADASQPTPPVALSVRAPGLAVKPLLRALKLPDDALGTVEIDADLRGTGRTPHAIAAGLDGHLGIAAVNAQIDNRVIADTLGKVLRQSKLPQITDTAGQTHVRCFAARLDSNHGVASLRGFLLDTSLLHIEGGGSINLADETLALRLQPLARVGETGVMVPLRVGGTWRNPQASVDATGAAGEAARLAEGAAEKNSSLGVIIGALGVDRMIPGAGRDNCADQLALARGGRAGPMPSQPAPAPTQTAPTPAGKPPGAPKPMDLLRQLLH